MTIKETLFSYLDSLTETVISGWGITDIINAQTGRRTYPHTIIKYCKEYADISGADFFCVDQNKSQWKFIPGCCKLSGTIISGRE